jgi:hypothetical protein
MHGCRQFAAIFVLLCGSGCEIGRTMFQMDSNSGSPFLGVDLLPSRKTTAVPKRTRQPGAETIPVVNETPGPQKPVKLASNSPLPRKEPSLLESLKLKRPERIPLALTPSDEVIAVGPAEEFR